MFKKRYLDGCVKETLEDNVHREVFYDNGMRHGFYRELGPSKQFLAIGRFVNGNKIGSHCRWTEGGSFLQLMKKTSQTGECFFLVPTSDHHSL